MTKPRVTTADRLSNIIEVVELGRRSGLLRVERGSQQALEQGEVYFSQGRAIYAVVEGLAGRDALNVLAGWGQCRFAFEPNAPRPTPNVMDPQRPDAAPGRPERGPVTPSRGAPASFNWNVPGNRPLPDPFTPGSQPGVNPGANPSQQRGPQTGSQTGGSPSNPASFGSSWPTGWPSSAPNGVNTSGQLNWPSQTGSLSAIPSNPSGASSPSQGTGPFTGAPTGAVPGSGAFSPATLERRPRRAPDVRDLISVVSAYNLSRNHRTLLLLADGEHTLLDLARLSSKPVDEIVTLLADLERLGLVYYYQ